MASTVARRLGATAHYKAHEALRVVRDQVDEFAHRGLGAFATALVLEKRAGT
jgi:hypothetical protein